MVLAPAVKGAIILTPMVLAAGVALYESNEEFRGFCDNTYKKINDFADEHGLKNPFAQRQRQREREREGMAFGGENGWGRGRKEWIPLDGESTHRDSWRRSSLDRDSGRGSIGERDIKKEVGRDGEERMVNVTGVDVARSGARRRGSGAGTFPNPLEMNPTQATAAAGVGAGLPLSIAAVESLNSSNVDAQNGHESRRSQDEHDVQSMSDFSTHGQPTPAASEPSIIDGEERFDSAFEDMDLGMDTRSDTTETMSQGRTMDNASDASEAWERDDVSVASSGWSEVGSEVSFESMGGLGRR